MCVRLLDEEKQQTTFASDMDPFHFCFWLGFFFCFFSTRMLKHRYISDDSQTVLTRIWFLGIFGEKKQKTTSGGQERVYKEHHSATKCSLNLGF